MVFDSFFLYSPSSRKWLYSKKRETIEEISLWFGLDCMFFLYRLVPKPFVVFYVASWCGFFTAISLHFFGILFFLLPLVEYHVADFFFILLMLAMLCNVIMCVRTLVCSGGICWLLIKYTKKYAYVCLCVCVSVSMYFEQLI